VQAQAAPGGGDERVIFLFHALSLAFSGAQGKAKNIFVNRKKMLDKEVAEPLPCRYGITGSGNGLRKIPR